MGCVRNIQGIREQGAHIQGPRSKTLSWMGSLGFGVLSLGFWGFGFGGLGFKVGGLGLVRLWAGGFGVWGFRVN